MRESKVMLTAVAIIVLGVLAYCQMGSSEGDYADFAKCLSEKSVKICGTFWCSACKKQREMSV